MSKVSIQGNSLGTGTFTIASPNSNTDRTLTLPDATGTVNTSGAVNEVPAGSASAPAIFTTGDTNTGEFFPAADTIAWTTGGTERGRFTAGGYFKVSNDGSYNGTSNIRHEFTQTANDDGLEVRVTNASYGSNALVVLAARNTTNNSFYALGYYNTGAAAFKLRVADSGNVTNTNNSYGQISDIKTKQDIVDAASQWNDIKNIRVRKFRFKNDPTGPLQIGVVAQELEQVSAGLIEEHPDRDEENNDLGTSTKSVKYSILYMKAVKALQEAMERIETLEAQNAAFEVRLAALEAK